MNYKQLKEEKRRNCKYYNHRAGACIAYKVICCGKCIKHKNKYEL